MVLRPVFAFITPVKKGNCKARKNDITQHKHGNISRCALSVFHDNNQDKRSIGYYLYGNS